LRPDNGAALFRAVFKVFRPKGYKPPPKRAMSALDEEEELTIEEKLEEENLDEWMPDNFDDTKVDGFRPVKFIIMMTYMQIHSGFKANYDIVWPPLLKKMMRFFCHFQS
jgi:hypothetical protein